MTTSKETLLQALIMDPQLERLEDLLAEFNLFDVLKIGRREVQHSATLAWLLDPRGSHGLRSYFVHKFLQMAAALARDQGTAVISPLDVDNWHLDDLEVATERHKIDILLVDQTDRFVCLIENKVGTGEHSDQLSRYLRAVEKEYPNLLPFPIFLTPDGTPPDDEDDAGRYVSISYQTVADLLDQTLETRGSTIGVSVSSFIQQYRSTLRRHVLSTGDNIDDLALQVYRNHRAAFDLILQARESNTTSDWYVIDEAFAQHSPLLQADQHIRWYHRYFCPELEGIPELHQGSGWTTTGRMVLFEFKYRTGRLVLIIGPGPQETRQRIYDWFESNEIEGVTTKQTSKLNNKWHTLYSRQLARVRQKAEEPYLAAKSRVEETIAEFFERDYWPLVNGVRTALDLPSASGGQS